MDYERWLNEAIAATGALHQNMTFLLKDLFDGVRWRTLQPGERRELGRQFKIKVVRNLVPNVKYLGKADNNSARYIKVEGEINK